MIMIVENAFIFSFILRFMVEHFELIGNFFNCRGAINKAKLDHPDWKIDGCFYCCKDCHNL